MTIAVIENCCGVPTNADPRAAMYADRDLSIRGLFGLSGPRPGDADYVAADSGAALAPTDNIVDPFAPVSHTKTYLAFGVAALAAVGLYYYMR